MENFEQQQADELQKRIEVIMKKEREKIMGVSSQLTLGELIEKLEAIPERENGEDKEVLFDFEYAFPTEFGSWRGVYRELALGFAFVGYGLGDNQERKEPTLKEFIKMCKETIGKEFTGWKGGEFIMDENTPIWVANDGNSGETGIVGVKDEGWRVRLLTELCEL